jgi:hypothetical protein
MTYPKTIASVNAQFKKLGLIVRAVPGNGYFYWKDVDGNFPGRAESVYVCHARDYSMENWIQEGQRANEAALRERELCAAPQSNRIVLVTPVEGR